jgi:gluconokinase
MDQPATSLLDPYRSQWPRLHSIPWYPALGDGACNNVGSGCITPDRFALMVGTSGAMRGVVEAEKIEIPEGLWCYRVDRRRYVLGGALSNGGEVFAWMKRTLAFGAAANDEIEKQLAAMAPGSHGLTVLPLFAGERSTGWRADARAAITGMSLTTGPMEILRASLESVALRFRNIYDVMSRVASQGVVAAGGALRHSPARTQMMATLWASLYSLPENEASGRGAALVALERLARFVTL